MQPIISQFYSSVLALGVAASIAFTNPALPVPEDLAAKNIASTRALLTWELPQAEPDDDKIDHYVINVYKNNAVIKKLESNSKKKVVTGLKPNTRYEFSVRSISVNKTKGYWSDLGAFTTAEPMRFVKLVDTADETLDTQWPGSDIDAVELVRDDGTSYAIKVVSSKILNGDIGNSHKDPKQALDAPNFFATTDTGYVSMGGPDAFIVLRMERSINETAKRLRVYEIGGAQGGVDEYVEVYLSETSHGPWIEIKEGTGIFTIKL